MTNLFKSLRDKWDAHLHSRYLKKMGWTEHQYQRNTDPDRNIRAYDIRDYYHGYKYIHQYTTTRGYPWDSYDDWLDAVEDIRLWCNENLQDKWREDIHRVIEQTAIDIDGSTTKHWFLNDIGGSDVMFFAFKDETDYTLFLLRWA
jgi:hypothetical protein